MENIREHIYLAALLHDIGKFYQRADSGSVKNSSFLNEHCKVEGTFCPQYNGHYSHKHVLWTAQFIEDFKPVFQKLVGIELNDLSVKDNLINLAACHHLSKDQLSDYGKLIKEADCLSSGMDRDSVDAVKDAQDESEAGWDSFKKKRMTSILETIGRNARELKEKTDWQHLPVVGMELSKRYFPKTKFDLNPDYSTLWNQFIGEFKFIQANSYRAFSETLLSLLLKYTSCVPASTINFPDVSLYDHLKTTAALSVCLYDYQQSGETGTNPFLLIGADFSGIQPYIYQIVSKYAGKNLKGRSFYLRILSDSVVRYLLKELKLFQANIVYNSGGGFYLLAPNTKFIKEHLEKAISTIENKLFANHGTNLYVAIDCIEVSKEALMHKGEEKLGEIWSKLFIKRDKKKLRKFASQINANYSGFFEPLMQGGNSGRDSITGEEFLPNESLEEKGGLFLKSVTAKQIQIGEKLRETDLIIIKEGLPLPYWKDKTNITPIDLGFTYYFLSINDVEQMKAQLKSSADEVSIITMNGKNGNCDFMRTVEGTNNIYGLDFYGGNETDKKNVPTFEDMCKNENLSRLGVLQMDVDNLGRVFQTGISKERATLSRYAALSRSFDFFFSGYLNTVWRETAPDKSFIVYSGGDDVFIVGSWDVAIQLAQKIRDDFKEYACFNDAFSLSGGIAIVPPKFPIMKGAEESAYEESLAKYHQCPVQVNNGIVDKEKNSISFMDMPLNWDFEFPAVVKLKDDLVKLLKDNNLPKSFLSKIMTHHINAKVENHKITVIKTYWMLTYDLTRIKGRNHQSDGNNVIDNCIMEICDNRKTLNGERIQTKYHALELWTFAVRWAELEYRKDKE